MRQITGFIALLLSLALLSACDTAPSPPNAGATPAPQAGATTASTSSAQSATPATGASAYPASGQAAQPSAYPAPGGARPDQLAAATAQALAANGYPPPTEVPGFKFGFNEPLKNGDTAVSGTGPEGVPIRLVNISRNGEQMGTTVIGNDGTFKIEVPKGLVGGEQLGLQIGNLAGTKYKPDQFQSGPGYNDIPQLGLMLATGNVQP